MAAEMNPVLGLGVLVFVGSVDGMTAAAACLRHSRNLRIHLVITQAFQVHNINMSNWPHSSRVGIIDLGVNNDGDPPNPKLTVEFVKKIYALGHVIQFIADEHGKNAWKEVFDECRLNIAQLTISPEDRSAECRSSCAILKRAFGGAVDRHTQMLLHAGDEADKLNFNTYFGQIFNQAIKPKSKDLDRRLHVVRLMAKQKVPDEKIKSWMREYAPMEANLPFILSSRTDLGDGISCYNCFGPHDASMVFGRAYEHSSVAVLMNGRCVSIGTSRLDLDLVMIIRKAGIRVSGMPEKANLRIEFMEAAIKAIRDAARDNGQKGTKD